MAIAFDCPCGRRLKVRDDLAGQTVLCPACGRKVNVPAEAESGSTAARANEDRPRPEQAAAERTAARAHGRDEDEEDQPRRRRLEDDDDKDDGREPSQRPAATLSMLATGSMFMSIASFLGLTFLAAVPAIVMGILALRRIRRSHGRLAGKFAAVAGIVLGSINVFLTVIVVAYLLSRNIGRALDESAARAKSTDNLRQIGLAMHNSCEANGGRIPTRGAITGADGKPLLSWRVAVWPYLEQDALFRQFHLDEPWDSPHNRNLVSRMPATYAHALASPSVTSANRTHYRAITGPLSAFEPRNGQPPRFPESIPDGTAHTILAVEAGEAVVWTKPDELNIRPGSPLPRLGVTFGEPFQVLMWDGSVRTVSPKVSPATLQAAMTANGGETLGPDW